MWIGDGKQKIHVSGSFTDKENACKFCRNFFLWGACYGHCIVENDDVHCNDTCEHFIEGGDEENV